MFKSVLFADINKAAYDVQKDGYCLDLKSTLKHSKNGYNMSFEGKNAEGVVGGKLTMDFIPNQYVSVKKLSLENNGNCVFEADLPNLLKNSTFMIKSQGEAYSLKQSMVDIGVKYMGERFSSDLMVDAINMSFISSMTYLRNNVILGCRLSGNRDAVCRNIDACIGYHYKDAIFSLGLMNCASLVSCAVVAEPLKNARISLLVDLPMAKEKPKVSFGFHLQNSKKVDTRLKLDSKGIVSASYKKIMNPNTTITVSAAIPMNTSAKNDYRMGFSLEIRV